MTLTVLIIVSLIWFVIGVIAARYVVPAVATATSTYNNLQFVQTVKWYGFRNTLTAYAKVYFWMLAMPVMARVKTAIATATSTYMHAVATSTTYMQHATAVATSIIETVTADVARDIDAFVDVATSIIDGLVMAVASDMPDTSTSTYALTLSADVAQYNAGEYLVRDNGMWRNVYLTAHARALIGDSADVIALSLATVIDASGSSKVWTVSFA